MSARVLELQRARGVHPRMLVLLLEWAKRGTFDVVVAMHGGVRLDQGVQSMLSGGGMSAASTLKMTPHGRGGALDLWPAGFLSSVPTSFGGTAARWGTWEGLPQRVRDEFAELGRFSQALGYRWGGVWVGKSYPHGDQPHHELADWQRLPFPPPTYEFPVELEALLSSGHGTHREEPNSTH